MKLSDSIVCLKMDELREACRHLQLSDAGQKRELIARLLARVEGTATPHANQRTTRDGKQEYRCESLMRPETYRSGAGSRAFLRKEIGTHFRFTTFGMDWIRQQWACGRCPSFAEFIEFWTQEHAARRQGKEFDSKPELARVNFFRRVTKQRKVTKAELEDLWKKERGLRAQHALSVLAKYGAW